MTAAACVSMEPLEPDDLAAPPVAMRMHTTCRIVQVSGNQALDGVDVVAEEIPVALVYNGVSHAVMLATPADLEDFALGFSLSEGIVRNKREIYDVLIRTSELGVEVHLEIASERFAALKARRRNLTGRTGCGLCGVESLAAAVRNPAPVLTSPAIHPDAILRAMAALPAQQALHALTGGAHAAAWSDVDGNILMTREDVGRHNALDKLIGALASANVRPDTGFVAVTSRASYEMVQKTATYGIGLLAAVSAPTAYAVRLATETRVTLVGFARVGRFSYYTRPNPEHASWN